MPCSKKDCDSILCDRHGDSYGYVCNSCFDEMEEAQDHDPEFTISKFLATSVNGPESEQNLKEVFTIRH